MVEIGDRKWIVAGSCGKKYLRGSPISVVVHRPDDSPIWTDLLKIKELYLRGRVIQTADGKKNAVLERCLDSE